MIAGRGRSFQEQCVAAGCDLLRQIDKAWCRMNSDPSDSLPTPFDDGEFYDVIGDIPYGLDFYVGRARRAAGPVVDIACGTGRILLPCLQSGVDIEGLDLYEPMLNTLWAKAGR